MAAGAGLLSPSRCRTRRGNLAICIYYIYHDTCGFSTTRRRPQRTSGNTAFRLPMPKACSGTFVRRQRNAELMRTEYDFSKGKRGAAMPQKGKTRISIFIDNVVLDAFRARSEKAGTGYQTMMNEALRQYLSEAEQPVTETILRNVLRQEIPEYFRATPRRAGKTRASTARRKAP